MTVTKNIYKVTKTKQLIDLNNDKVNFKLTFNVKSANNEPFYTLIVNQTSLDNGDELNYKNVTNGSIAGEIVSDKNNYQNYFLIIKADSPCDCEVTIDIEEIQPNLQQIQNDQMQQQMQQQMMQQQQMQQQMMQQQQMQQQMMQQQQMQEKDIGVLVNNEEKTDSETESPTSSSPLNPFEESSLNWKYIIIGVVILGLGIYAYYYFSTRKTEDKTPEDVNYTANVINKDVQQLSNDIAKSSPLPSNKSNKTSRYNSSNNSHNSLYGYSDDSRYGSSNNSNYGSPSPYESSNNSTSSSSPSLTPNSAVSSKLSSKQNSRVPSANNSKYSSSSKRSISKDAVIVDGPILTKNSDLINKLKMLNS
jgi:hypothetical protein